MEVPVPAVIFGLIPSPDFLKTIGSEDVPVAVMMPFVGLVKVSVCPATTLKETPPGPTPEAFNAVIAASMVA